MSRAPEALCYPDCMATALPLDFDPAAAPAILTSEDAAWLRSFAAFCEEEEVREPGVIDREIAAARTYGPDLERELNDIQAGRHPLQQPR